MTTKTFDKQTAKFLAVVGESMPELSGDVMQKWIQNPRAVQKALCNAFCPPGAAKKSTIISIDRTTPFDPVKFLGRGWTIDEQDERSLALAQVNLANVRLKHMLKPGETMIKGEAKLERLQEADCIRLDAKVFQTLWENQASIPESWKEKINGNTIFVFFDGTIFRDPSGDRCVLRLSWNVSRWYWNYHWLENDWRVGDPSAVLASI